METIEDDHFSESTDGFPNSWETSLARTDAASVDRWCSSLDWQTGVYRAFHPNGEIVAARSDGCCYAFSTVEVARDSGGALVPLDAMWLFGAPLVGDVSHVREMVSHVVATRNERVMYLGGYAENSLWWTALVNSLHRSGQLFAGDECIRCRASLDGGVDGYLSRRSREFRRNLRQGARRSQGISFDVVDDDSPEAVLQRIHTIEQKSWKGLEGSGIESPEMTTLYAYVVSTLAHRRQLRACIAIDPEGNDVGFVIGGVKDGTYRGLQISFVDEARKFGIGNLLQWHELQRLTSEQTMHTYDIGMDMEYKRAWAEEQFTTRLLVLRRD